MIYYIDIDNIPLLEPVNACIGYFDGVHRGHQQLLQNTINLKRKNGLPAAVITFDRSAAELFSSSDDFRHLTTLDQKIRLFEQYGIDDVYVFHFDREFAAMEGHDFELLLNRLNIRTLTCGADFSYGYKGKLKSEDLRTSSDRNFEVIIIRLMNLYNQKISSSRVKEQVISGNVAMARKLCGHTLLIEGQLIDNVLHTSNVVPENGRFRIRINGETAIAFFRDSVGHIERNDDKVVLEIVERLQEK